MLSTISLLRPQIPPAEALLPWLRRIDANAHYTNFGPLNAEFEQALAALHADGLPCTATSFANATAALTAWLNVSTARRKGLVLLPALTFTATAQAVLASGNTPWFADVDAATWLLCPQHAHSLAADLPLVAVLPVAAYGMPCPAIAWDEFARDTTLPVLIDAAGAFGNQTLGDAVDIAFSFHATKALAAGEGGAILSRRHGLAAELKRYSNFGIDTSNGETVATGSNAKLSEYHAAVALSSLAQWPIYRQQRQQIHRRYVEILQARCPSVELAPRAPDGIYTLMPVLLPAGTERDRVAARLAAAGVETRAWYCPPLPAQAHFQHCPRESRLPATEALGRRLLGLPFHPWLTEEDMQRIATLLATL